MGLCCILPIDQAGAKVYGNNSAGVLKIHDRSCKLEGDEVMIYMFEDMHTLKFNGF